MEQQSQEYWNELSLDNTIPAINSQTDDLLTSSVISERPKFISSFSYAFSSLSCCDTGLTFSDLFPTISYPAMNNYNQRTTNAPNSPSKKNEVITNSKTNNNSTNNTPIKEEEVLPKRKAGRNNEVDVH
jgi:hypothetical protein